MQQPLRGLASALAVVGISLAATGVLVLTSPDRSITLLIYLPGIVIVEALYGLAAGVAAVLLSLAGSYAIRMWFLHFPLQAPVGFYANQEEEIILLVVGLFVVILMELRRRSGERAVSGARKVAALMENVADGVLIFDSQQKLVSMNPAARILLNRPDEAEAGRRMEDLRRRFQFTPAAGGEPRPFEDASRLGLSLHDEGVIEDIEDHRRYDVLISVAPWRNKHNQIEGTMVMITDVTPLKEMQRRDLANARHLAMAQMISGLTHDFSHILDIVQRANAVLGMREDASADERRRYRDMIERAVQDGSDIVRRLRDYLAGGTEVGGQVDLAAAAHDAVALTSALWRTRPGVELVESLEPAPPVRGNVHDLSRVIANLIFNAVEALGSGGGRIEVHTGTLPNQCPAAARARSTPSHAVAWVEDTGPGIPADLQARLFEPYVTSKPHGMGLGLFSAQKILLAHGGRLSFTTSPGRGTRFTLELPAMSADSGDADAA